MGMILGELLTIILFFILLVVFVMSWRAMLKCEGFMSELNHETLIIIGVYIGTVGFILASVWLVIFLGIPETVAMWWGLEL